MYTTRWTIEVPHVIGETIAGYLELDVILSLGPDVDLFKIGIMEFGTSRITEWIMRNSTGEKATLWKIAEAEVERCRDQIADMADIPMPMAHERPDYTDPRYARYGA